MMTTLPLMPGLQSGHDAGPADAGGQVDQHGAFAKAGVAVEHGDLAERNPVGPKPFDRFGLNGGVNLDFRFRHLQLHG
jgi:hypothetical protein